MATEIVTTEDSDLTPPPLPSPPTVDEVSAKPSKKKSKEAAADDVNLLSTAEDKEAPLKQVSPTLQKIRAEEDAGLKEMLDDIGPDGSFKVVIRRREPKEVRHPATGKMVKVDGYLETVEKRIDEDYLKRHHGGGEYQIKIHKRDARGSMNIVAHRSIVIAGDPNLDNLPNNPAAPPVAGGSPSSGDSESVVKKTFDVLADELKAMREGAGNGKSSQDLLLLVEMLKSDREAQRVEMAELRRELSESRNKPAADDSFKETMIQQFVKDDGSRTQAVRLAYEAEIRALKEGFEQERSRLADRAERDRQQISDRADRDLQRVVDAKNAEIATIRAAAEQGKESLKIAQETQITVYKSEISKLERDNKDLREEIRELRLKKDKSLIEQAKELKTIKEALSDDDGEEGEKSTVEKFIEALPAVPAAVQAARGMFTGQQQPGQQQVQQARPVVQSKKEIFADAHGNKFSIVNGKLIPLKRKDAPPPPPPGQVALPPVDPVQTKMAVTYLENAFANSTDPKVIAQSGRTHMSEAMIVAIRELGIEGFLIKVGGVPMSSPLLASLKGKNWIRAVGKEILGEE